MPAHLPTQERGCLTGSVFAGQFKRQTTGFGERKSKNEVEMN
jgi:hypothetical protein